MISTVSAFDWTDDIVSYWKMDEVTGVMVDSLGISDATNNGATYNTAGIIGATQYFDGANDNMTIPYNAAYSPTIGLTINTWIYRNSTSPVDFVFSSWNGATENNKDYELALEGSKLIFQTGDPGATNKIIGTTTITPETWHMVTGRWNGTHIDVYVDGVRDQLTSPAVTAIYYGTTDLAIGSRVGGYGKFNGSIDEIGFWNRSLNQADITELYNGGAGLPYAVPVIINVNLESPSNGTIISDVGTNFIVSGNNIASINAEWTNITYNIWNNGTLFNSTTVDFTNNETFNETLFIDNFTFSDYIWNANACYVNITGNYCISATNNNTFSVSLFTLVSETYVNDTISGTLNNFSISIDLLEGYDLLDAHFMYNGTNETPIITATGENRYLLVSDYAIPILLSDVNLTFYWGLTFTGDIDLNSTERTQLVRSVLLDSCSVYTNKVFNLSLFDEKEKTTLNGDIEIIYSILNVPNYDIINTVHFKVTNVSSAEVCSGINLSGENLAYSAEIRYVSDGYAPELYHIQKAILPSSGTLINLYDLNESSSTEFEITYQDSTFNFVDGAIIQLQRKYISENIYEVVEAPLTSRDGVSVVHIDLDSVKYKATVVKDGEVLDIFDNIVFNCESELTGECTQKLLGEVNPQNSQETSDLLDFSYAITLVNNTITTSFTIPSGTPSSINILLKQVDSFGITTLSNRTITSSAGSVDCDYNNTIGDSRVYLTITKDEEIYVNQGYFIAEDIDLGFAGNNYLIVLLFLLTLVGMAFASPEWIVIIGIVAFVIAGGLWLINGMNLVIGLGMMIFVIIAAAILIMKMTKQEDI